jgi:subtilisin family serine protease
VASEIAQEKGLEVIDTYEYALEGFAAKIPEGRIEEVRSDPRVEFVAQDRVVKATAQKEPTGIDRVEADQSSTAAIGGDGSLVDGDIAILDSGIYTRHSDLNVSGGKDCSKDRKKTFSDDNGHGTHVAGTAAAKDNTTGVVGVAPGARLWAVKVLKKDNTGSFADVMCGIDWVTATKQDSDSNNDIEVANMSLGGDGSDSPSNSDCTNANNDPLHRAICRSVAVGVTYVVAAGNDAGDADKQVPAAYDEVLTVAAMADSDGKSGGTGRATSCGSRSEEDDRWASFSNFGTDVDIAAPGVCITSTWKGSKKKRKGAYKTISGTSMASPHVAGTAVLCIASGKCTGTPEEIMNKLRQDAAAQPATYGFTGDPTRPSGNKYYGYLEYAGY